MTFRVALVCLGNICRSPMAHVVLEDRLRAADLDHEVEVVSAGTGGWHVGNGMDERAATTLTRHGLDPTRHRARRFTADWLDDCDLVLTMDAANRRDVAALGPDSRVRMFRDFDPRATDDDHDVPDPYQGSGDRFEDVLAVVERTCDGLVAVLPGLLLGVEAGG